MPIQTDNTTAQAAAALQKHVNAVAELHRRATQLETAIINDYAADNSDKLSELSRVQTELTLAVKVQAQLETALHRAKIGDVLAEYEALIDAAARARDSAEALASSKEYKAAIDEYEKMTARLREAKSVAFNLAEQLTNGIAPIARARGVNERDVFADPRLTALTSRAAQLLNNA